MKKLLIIFVALFASISFIFFVADHREEEKPPVHAFPRVCQVSNDVVLKRINSLRKTALTYDESLSVYAGTRLSEVKINFNHDGFYSDVHPSLPGYKFVGENLARGYCDEVSMVNAWINSPGHFANMIDERYDFIGISFKDGYAVTIFGSLD